MASFIGLCERETIPAPPPSDHSTPLIPERTPRGAPARLPLRLSLVLAWVDGVMDVGRLTDVVGFAPDEVYAALLDLETLGLVRMRGDR